MQNVLSPSAPEQWSVCSWDQRAIELTVGPVSVSWSVLPISLFSQSSSEFLGLARGELPTLFLFLGFMTVSQGLRLDALSIESQGCAASPRTDHCWSRDFCPLIRCAFLFPCVLWLHTSRIGLRHTVKNWEYPAHGAWQDLEAGASQATTRATVTFSFHQRLEYLQEKKPKRCAVLTCHCPMRGTSRMLQGVCAAHNVLHEPTGASNAQDPVVD